MNTLHWILAGLALVFIALYARSPKRPRSALAYLRYALLCLAAAVVLTPFFWLICAAFKD